MSDTKTESDALCESEEYEMIPSSLLREISNFSIVRSTHVCEYSVESDRVYIKLIDGNSGFVRIEMQMGWIPPPSYNQQGECIEFDKTDIQPGRFMKNGKYLTHWTPRVGNWAISTKVVENKSLVADYYKIKLISTSQEKEKNDLGEKSTIYPLAGDKTNVTNQNPDQKNSWYIGYVDGDKFEKQELVKNLDNGVMTIEVGLVKLIYVGSIKNKKCRNDDEDSDEMNMQTRGMSTKNTRSKNKPVELMKGIETRRVFESVQVEDRGTLMSMEFRCYAEKQHLEENEKFIACVAPPLN